MMSSDLISIDLNTKELEQLVNLGPRLPKSTAKGIGTGLAHSILYLQSKTPPYPPKLPTSMYRRTGTLGRTLTGQTQSGEEGWVVNEVGGKGLKMYGRWGTKVPYGHWVVGEDQGAAFIDRWWQLSDILAAELNAIVGLIEKDVWVEIKTLLK